MIVVARPRRAGASLGRAAEEATITTPTADLRREPSSRAAVAAVLPAGARVSVVGEKGGLWVEVRAPKSVTGFVSAESLERDSDREARRRRGTKVLSFAPVFGVVGEEAPIRLAPFPLSPRAGTIRRGTTVAIYGVDHAYYALKAGDGTLAFLDSSAVDLVPRDPREPAIVADPARALKDVSLSNVPREEAPTPEISAEGVPAEPAETSDEALEPAVLLSKVDPAYPESARRSSVEGTVVLDAQIGANGRVEDVQVLRGLPLGLSEAAAEAVRRWQYRPARGRTGPVPSHKTVRIVFTLGQ